MASAPAELNKNTFNNAFTFSHCSISYFRNYLGKLTRYMYLQVVYCCIDNCSKRIFFSESES